MNQKRPVMKFRTTIIATSLIFLAACAAPTHRAPDLVGKWSYGDSSGCVWEFRGDGTVDVRCSDGSKQSGHYALLGANRIALDFRNPNLSGIDSFSLSEKQLILIPAKGAKSVLNRVQ